MKKKLAAFCLTTAILLTALAGCATATPAGPQVLKFGIAVPLSGPAAGWGIAIQEILQFRIDEINSAGGLTVDGQNYVWELVSYDSQYMPTETVTAVQRLLDSDQVHFVGILGAENLLPAQPLTEAAGAILWGWAAANQEYVGPEHPLTFMYAPDAELTAVVYEYLATYNGVRRVISLQPDDTVGQAHSEFANFAAPLAGVELVAEEFVDVRSVTDFYPVLTPLLDMELDLLDVSQCPPGVVGQIIAQARELGYAGPVYSAAADMPTLIEMAGWEALEGYYTIPYLTDLTPAQQEFQAGFIERYGEDHWVGSLAFTVYDTMTVFSEAIVGAQSLDTTEIAEYMADMTIESVWGAGGGYFTGSKYYGIDRIYMTPLPLGVVRGGEMVQLAVLEYPSGILSDQ